MDEQKVELLSGKSVRQNVKLKAGLTREDAKKITTLVKEKKMKVTAQVVDDKVRVTGKSKDDLQECIQAVQAADFGFPIQIDNLR